MLLFRGCKISTHGSIAVQLPPIYDVCMLNDPSANSTSVLKQEHSLVPGPIDYRSSCLFFVFLPSGHLTPLK
jgi:hypothetical protein